MKQIQLKESKIKRIQELDKRYQNKIMSLRNKLDTFNKAYGDDITGTVIVERLEQPLLYEFVTYANA